jgi:hypothetical protein
MDEIELSELVKKVTSKTIGHNIEPVKYEDIPSKLTDILSKCLKRHVEVSGNGLDGNDIIVSTNEGFEDTVNKQILNETYKHDYEDSSHLINPYLNLIDVQKMLKIVNDIKKENKRYDERRI